MGAHRRLLALLMVALAAPAAARGQATDPGGVVTTVVTLAPPAGARPDSVHYRVEMADGFRLFARAAGAAEVRGDLIRLPLTFGVAPTAPAGDVQAGRVVADWDGAETVATFHVEVRPRFEISFWLGAEESRVSPGAPLEIGYRLGNRGNAEDTVLIRLQAPGAWTQRVTPARVILAAGDTAVGTIQLVPPEDAAPGVERLIVAEARGREADVTRATRVVVVGEDRWFGDLASVPSTVFLGSSTGSGGIGGVAVRAQGQVRPGTRLSIDYRYNDQPVAAPAFRSALTGPRFRIGLQQRDLQLRVGDVFTRSDLFTGPSVHGAGLDLAWSVDDLDAAIFVAKPVNGLGDEDGHVIRASTGLRTGMGTFSASFSDLRRDASVFDGYDIRAGGVRYDLAAGPHRLRVQAGVMRVSSDTIGARTGATVEAEYRLGTNGASLTARVRTVPAVVQRTATFGDELLLSGSADLFQGLSAIGWGFATRSPLLGVREEPWNRGLVAGLRYLTSSSAQLQLTGNLRTSEAPAYGTSLDQRTLRGTVDAPVGPFVAELDAEFGHAIHGLGGATTTLPYRYLRVGARWSAGSQWGWLGMSYRDTGLGQGLTYVDVAGALEAGRVELQGGLSSRLGGVPLPDALSVWTGTTVEITRDIRATLGVDYLPTGLGDRWRFSLGLTRAFNLPLPMRREPHAYGMVYEDRNGNRVRDDGEPALPGVVLRLGILSDTTDQDGHFAFMDPVQGRLAIDGSRLPLGLMVPSDVALPAAGYVEIPVVRTAALEIQLFIDRDNDGERDTAEDPASGVVVSVTGPDGRTRDVAADARGSLRLNGLTPGHHTLRIHPPATRRTGGPPIEVELDVPPGGTVSRTIAVPLRQREIRIGGSTMLQRR